MAIVVTTEDICTTLGWPVRGFNDRKYRYARGDQTFRAFVAMTPTGKHGWVYDLAKVEAFLARIAPVAFTEEIRDELRARSFQAGWR